MSEDSGSEDRGRAVLAAAYAPRAAGAKSGFALFQAFMTSTPVTASTLTAAMVISGIGWSDMARRAKEDDSHLAKSSVEAKVRAARPSYDPRLVEGLPGASGAGPNALEMFRLKNRDAVRGNPSAPAPETESAQGPEETPAEAEALAAASAEAPAQAAALKAVNALASGPEEKKEEKARDGKTKKLAKAGPRPSLGGGGGLAGGFSRGFDVPIQRPAAAPKPEPRDRLSAARTTGGRRADGRAVSGSRSRRAGGVQSAAQKLRSMNKAMQAAGTAGSATTASTHNSQWDGAAGSVGQGLSGSGASGNAIQGGGQAYDEGGIGEGGPLNAGGTNGAAASSEAERPPSTGAGKNVTPNQKMIDAAMILLPIASLLLLGAFLTGQNPAMKGAAKMLAYGALVVSGIVAGIGAMILTKGQAMQGGLLAAVGGALAVISYTAAEGNAAAAKGDEIAKEEAIQWAGPDGPTGPTIG